MPQRIVKLDHVQIAAPRECQDQLRAFYGDGLGLMEIEKPEPLRSRGGLWFSCGNMEMHIGIDDPPPINRTSRRHVAFETDDLEAMRERLTARGCEIEEDQAPIPAYSRFYTRDPAGNRVEILQRCSL